jgi:multicomponent Na+:H+ antiporter subunit C
MESVFALSVGGLVGISVYMFLARDLPRVLIGFVLLGSAANLTIFVVGRIGSVVPPIVPPDLLALPLGAANPLPQALILTAIVIGFGLTVFALMLVVRAQRTFSSVESEDMDEAEPADAAVRAAAPGGRRAPEREAA